MSEKLSRKASGVIKSNLVDLSEIVESNLSKVVLKCEQDKIISSTTKRKLGDAKTGQSDFERASSLVSEVQTAVRYCPEKLEPFLITIFNIDTLRSKRVAIKLANKYGECMPEFIETVDDSGDDELIPLLTARGAPQLATTAQPTTKPAQPTTKPVPCTQPFNESDLVEDNRVNEELIEDNREDDGEDSIHEDFSLLKLGKKTVCSSMASPIFEYDMAVESDKSRGIALLINNKFWKNDKEGAYTRHGSEKDIELISETMCSLQYHTVTDQNLTVAQMKQAVKDASEKVKPYHKSFICCIMSHGNDDGIEGVDGMVVTATELAKCITPQNLVSKPKIFVIQACRGEDTPRELIVYDAKEDNIKVKGVPPDADYLFAYSSTPSTKSMRHITSGAFYIQLLCKYLKEHRQTCSLYEIILMVHHELATSDKYCKDVKRIGGTYRQMGEVISTLRGKIYFK